MGWIGTVVIIALLVAMNLYFMDTLVRMRADLRIIRRAVAPSKEGFVDPAAADAADAAEAAAPQAPQACGPEPQRRPIDWRAKLAAHRGGPENPVAAFFRGMGFV